MSELRQDLISGDWVIIAPGRVRRPDELIKRRPARKPAPVKNCPFEDFQKSGNAVVFSWPGGVVIPNKYPALAHAAVCSAPLNEGIYNGRTGVGNHELVVTRDHRKNFADLEPAAAAKVFEVIRMRIAAMAKDPCYSYVSAFFNWGRAAGASVWHPHYQLLTLPVIPPHVAHSLQGSEIYFKRTGRCARCDVIAFERKGKRSRANRVVAENAHAIAIAPYASKRPFEVGILPKCHAPFFEKTSAATIRAAAAITQTVLRSMRRGLHDPDYNAFIHSAPIDGKPYAHHHWHIEIVPVDAISPIGGFEISTIININVVDPSDAARILRKG